MCFLFNPFSIHIFRTVIHNIWKSYEQRMRDIHIILYYPPYDYLQFLHRGTPFELLHEVQIENETNLNERLCVFELKSLEYRKPTLSFYYLKYRYK